MTRFYLPLHLIVSLSLAAIGFAVSRMRNESSDCEDVFHYPPGVGYLMLGGAAFFTITPLLPGAHGTVSPLEFSLVFLPWVAVSVAAYVYFTRFRVIVNDDTLSFGTFRLQRYPLADIVDVDVLPGPRSQATFYLRDGRRLTLSSLLSDFASLVDTIRIRSDCSRAHFTPSPVKLSDQRRRAALNLWLSWILGAAVVMIAVAMFVSRK